MMPKNLMKLILIALVIVSAVGPSAGPPQDDEDFEVLDLDEGEFQESEYPRDPNALEDHDLNNSEDYYSPEDAHMEPKMHPGHNYKYLPSEDFLHGFECLPLNEKANGNPAADQEPKRMIQFPWSKGRKGKPASKMKNHYCRVSPPTGRPGCHGPTTQPHSSPSCHYTPKPTAAPPPPQQPTRKPPHCKDQSGKGRQKSRPRPLTPKTAKMLLNTIMDTKQHVLFTLEILNHMENEVLFRSPDSCRPDSKKKKPGKSQKYQAYGDYHRKEHSAMAKMKKQRQKQQLALIDPQENWCPAAANQVNPPKNLLENALQPKGLNKHSYKKYHNHGQKQQQQQAKLNKIPPGMVTILT